MSNPLLKIPSCILLASLIFVLSPTAKADDSVKKRLDERGIKHEIDADGDFKVVYSYTKEKRTQLVFVSGKTETVNNTSIREIFSPAANIKTSGIDGTKALELMRESRKNKLGSWEIEGDILYLVIKLPENLSSSELETAMDIAAETADDMELKLTGKDEL